MLSGIWSRDAESMLAASTNRTASRPVSAEAASTSATLGPRGGLRGSVRLCRRASPEFCRCGDVEAQAQAAAPNCAVVRRGEAEALQRKAGAGSVRLRRRDMIGERSPRPAPASPSKVMWIPA